MSSVDVIIVGSGASATGAAFPLVEAGLSVLMLDPANVDARYAPLIPDVPFSRLRATDPDQHRYFLGDDFEGIPSGNIRVGAQLTPPRKFIVKDTDRLLPTMSEDFAGFSSLARGGLSAGWGAISVEFQEPDLEGFPITRADLAPHYESVTARVGISGDRDDLLPYYGESPSLQPPLELDTLSASILGRYGRKRSAFHAKGVRIGRPRLAVLSRDLDGRKGQSYHDMDFYSDRGKSVFRAGFAVDDLESRPGFRLASPFLVERFRETPEGVVVTARDLASGARRDFTARRLVIAAGVMGSARIVLRSFDAYDRPLPILANPYTYGVCLHMPVVGKRCSDRRHSLTQLAIVVDPDGTGRPPLHAQIYSYRSLLLFKVAREAPLPLPDGFRCLRDAGGAFAILAMHHEDRPSPGKRCILRRGAPGEEDPLEIVYELDPETRRKQDRLERLVLRLLWKVGCWPIRRTYPGHGSSIHYGGTLPMSSREEELTTTPECRLRGTRGVYVADGSVLPWLPSKAPTLTFMANAERVGTIVAKELGARGTA
jgi:choline dehydrogenase-like flavoprotein